MGAGDGSATSRTLMETPTWALATVCFVFITLSLFIEHLIHLLSGWLKTRRKTAMFEAVEKLKSVLILLGFMSLILAVTQRSISKICIPNKVANKMLPCRQDLSTKTTEDLELTENIYWELERKLAETNTTTSPYYCEAKNMTSLISEEGINQLNIFIFVLAAMQIVSCVLTMTFGRLKMKRWKSWEKETQTVEYQAANDPNRFRYTRQTTFGRRHMNSWSRFSLHLWMKCFLRQFFNSVARVDYLTLRHGFIAAHLSTNNNFNFQKYIRRSLEDDFKVVVGISPYMWLIVVIFILLDVHGYIIKWYMNLLFIGWDVYLWVSFLPLLIVLVLGTKLEMIVVRMALQLQDQTSVIRGTPVVQPNDNLFWFSQPKYVLTLIHITLFVNAFEIAFFVWVTFQFGLKSCYHERTEIIVTRVVIAVIVQVLCSYITLPLYALVTQMGSQFKSAVLEEQTANVIKRWHRGVRQNRKKQSDSSVSTIGGNATTSSQESSSLHREPSLAEIETISGQNEITERHTAAVAQIEMPEITNTEKYSDLVVHLKG